MRYCSNCGALNDTDANFCSGCGIALKPLNENADINNNQNMIYTTKADSANNSYQPVYSYTQGTPEAANPSPLNATETPVPVKGKVLGILSFVFGIVSTALSWISIIPLFGQIIGFLYLAMAIVGLIFSGKSEFRLAKPGKILCIIGIV
ncbi:MAG: zinc-ribbon domain-containing protein, partial [Lachnospiraceae bacterium]|nr:zinc-ribbon domain-containing protein [Lachnospiraceae bacterium]